MEYNALEIEKKWQEYWHQNHTHEPIADFTKPKKYILSMFPYPSGSIHMGHVRNYCLGDAMARYYRKEGFNVLHPIGFDAFGMPAENAAIKHGIHPKNWTYQNIQNMDKELDSLGFSFSKEREFATCDAGYTKWEQHFFLDMWDRGLVYRKKAFLNWCPNDKTVLANEQVSDGCCWRCGHSVEQKEMYQYYIKITDYADELLRDLKTLEGKWPSAVLLMQENWIGKSSGLEFCFELEEAITLENGQKLSEIQVFTTRADTIFGVTYCALAPEHPLVAALISQGMLSSEVKEAIQAMQKKSARARAMEDKEGVALGVNAIHPITKEKIPLWVANFVLMDYGSGAVMSVPAHDERDNAFAIKYNLPIRAVINSDEPFEDKGSLVDSKEFSGLSTKEAREKIIQHFEAKELGKRVINFRLKDWGISRQRYWGAPIPLIHCKTCGIVAEKRENLPITLPEDVRIDGEGNPLDKHQAWQQATCPKCGNIAHRETDTMDTFFQSSWYFLRYTTQSDKWDEAAFDEESVKYWMGVDEYIGGIEHAILHLLYARFFTKVLRDLSYIDFGEPFLHLLTQGMVLKDGAKMSKSKGNVVPPNEIIQKYGADTARLFILFAAPPTKELEWNDSALEGGYRFIRRFVERSSKVKKCTHKPTIDSKNLKDDEKYARKKVYEALLKSEEIFSKKQPGFAFNTLIAACMEAFNALSAQENIDVWTEGYFILASVLEPIIPHICWEISATYFDLKNLGPIDLDPLALVSQDDLIIISINGKKRTEIRVSKNASKEEVLKLAYDGAQKWLDGKEVKKEVFVPGKLVNFVIG